MKIQGHHRRKKMQQKKKKVKDEDVYQAVRENAGKIYRQVYYIINLLITAKPLKIYFF